MTVEVHGTRRDRGGASAVGVRLEVPQAQICYVRGVDITAS